MSLRNLVARVGKRMRGSLKELWRAKTGPSMTSVQAVPDEAFLALFDLQGHAPSKEALMAHYRRRVDAIWPAPPSIIRDLRVKIDDLGRDELVALADSILEFRFVLRQHAPRVTPDGRVDWGGNPTSDREWLWALHRHQWWPILGLAYAQTGDERYAAAFVAQMRDWIELNPPCAQKNEKSPSWRLMEVGMRLRVSWIPCFGLFYHSPTFTDKAKLEMLRAIYDHVQFLLLFRTRNNHFVRESNGLAYAGVCFPEFREAGHWLEVALARLEGSLVEQVNPDGSHFELSTGYQSLIIDEFQNTYELLQAYDLSLPGEDLAFWLERMYHVMAYLIRPDKSFPQVNDGYVYWAHTQLALAGRELGRDDLVYIGSGGMAGTCPADTSAGFKDAGLYVMRSDWTGDARYMLFDAGPYGGYHGHEDKLNIEVSAFGQTFIVDSSSYTYHGADPFRAHFVSSLSHNTVVVDGKSQVRRWREENRYPRTGIKNDVAWVSRPEFDYVSASYDAGYGRFRLKKAVDAEVIEDVVHTRRILFVKPDYWVIVDELEASVPHNYQVLYHTLPKVRVSTGSDGKVILGTVPEAAALYLIPAEPSNVKVRCVCGSESPIQGWYSAGSGHKAPATAVIFEQENALSTVITTLVYPVRRAQGRPVRQAQGRPVRQAPLGGARGKQGGQVGLCLDDETDNGVGIRPLDVSGGQGMAFVVTTDRGRDYVLFARAGTMAADGSVTRFGPYQSAACVAGVRTDRRGDVVAQFEWNPLP